MTESETRSLKELLVSSARDLRHAANPTERAEAARRLGRSRSRIAVSYLIDALADDYPEVGLAAVEGLAELRDATAIGPLRSLLDRQDYHVSNDAILAAIEQIKAAEPASSSNQGQNVALQAAARVSTDEERQRLEDVYRRAAEERHMIEASRRKATEEAKRRADEERLRLQTEAEGVTRLNAELARRREDIEKARTLAEEESRRLKHLEEQVRSEEMNRRLLEQESLRLDAEIRLQMEQERHRAEALRRLVDEQKKLGDELEQAWEAADRLRADAEAKHRAEEGRLRLEQQNFERATAESVALRLAVEAARKQSEDEIVKLKEACERILIEEEVCRQTEQDRLELEAEIRVRVEDERRRLEEMRALATQSQERLEEEARLRADEETRRLSELKALKERYESETQERTTTEQELRAEIDALCESTEKQVKELEDLNSKRDRVAEELRKVHQELENEIQQATQRPAEEALG